MGMLMGMEAERKPHAGNTGSFVYGVVYIQGGDYGGDGKAVRVGAEDLVVIVVVDAGQG